MDHSRILILAVAVIAVSAMAVSAFAVLGAGNDRDQAAAAESTDIVGHWYLIRSEIVGSDGTARNIDIVDGNLSAYELDVFYESNGLFYGEFLQQAISGSSEGGTVEMKLSIAVGGAPTEVWLHGGMTDARTLILSATSYSVGTASPVAGTTVVFSKDRYAATASPTMNVNLSGTWNCCSSTVYTSEGAVSEHGVSDLILTQTGCVVAGIMSDAVAGSASSVRLAGAFSCQSAARTTSFILNFYDEAGVIWTAEYHAGTLICTCFGDRPDGDGVLCIERTYTQHGDAPVAPEQVVLSGIDWNCTMNTALDRSFSLSFSISESIAEVKSYGNICFGQATDSEGTYECVGVFSADKMPMVMVYSGYTDVDPMMSVGRFLDARTVSVTAFNQGQAERMVFETKQDEYDCTGHWNAASYQTFGVDGQAVNTSGGTGYNLDVYAVEGNTVRGSFAGVFFAGVIGGSIFRFSVEVADGTEQVACQMLNQRTMLACGIVYRGSSGSYNAWSCLLTSYYAVEGELPILAGSADYSGTWQLSFGQTYNGSRAVGLQGRELEISAVNGNTFSGTMEQTVGTAVVAKTVRGVIYANDGELLAGFMLDQTGRFWTMTYDLGTGILALAGLNLSVVTDLNGQIVCSLCCYTRDGTGVLPEPSAAVAGTVWQAVSHETMTPGGVYSQETTAALKFTVTDQNYSQFGGQINDNGYLIPFVGNLYGNHFILISRAGDNQPDRSYGSYFDGRIYLYAFVHDAETGQYQATVTVFEQVGA